jgi:hypothetical protein
MMNNECCHYCGAVHRSAGDECHPTIERMFELLEDAEDKKLILAQRIAKLEGRQPPWFNAGDLVWYEPSDGLRFAGEIVGKGTLEGCYRVRLASHYWAWKKRRLLAGESSRVAPAISGDRLYWRIK